MLAPSIRNSMPSLLRTLFNDEPGSTKAKIVTIYAILVGFNLAAWFWALVAFHRYPVLLGMAFLAYGFGLRHAVDADHIASIDNVTRKLMQQGKRPVAVGLMFSLGHSTIVIVGSLAIAATALALQHRIDAVREVGGAKNYSKIFRNAFYKFEVINIMSELQNPSILLDVDCIWTKRDEDLFEVLMCGNNLLLQDTYQNSLRPDKKNHDLNMKDMSELYKTIPINSFKSEHAIRYGGELIGGSSEQLKIIANKLLLTIDYCKEQYDLGNEIQFNNGFSIFSGMEFISSYIYNSL